MSQNIETTTNKIQNEMNDIFNKINDTYYNLIKSSSSSTATATNTTTIKNPNNYSSTKKHNSCLNKRKIIKKRRQIPGYLTDASESSFDSTLIDCFNSLATYSDSDDYVVLNKKYFNRSKKSYYNHHHSKKQKRLENASRVRFYQSSQNKSKSKRKFILLSSSNQPTEQSQSTTATNSSIVGEKERNLKRKCSFDQQTGGNDDINMETDNNCFGSDNEGENDNKSSLSETEETDDREADDEQSDWPVNEPSIINLLNNKKIKIDENDENDEDNDLKTIFNNTFQLLQTSSNCSRFKNRVNSLMVTYYITHES
jgi:hypothetical protein